MSDFVFLVAYRNPAVSRLPDTEQKDALRKLHAAMPFWHIKYVEFNKLSFTENVYFVYM